MIINDVNVGTTDESRAAALDKLTFASPLTRSFMNNVQVTLSAEALEGYLEANPTALASSGYPTFFQSGNQTLPGWAPAGSMAEYLTTSAYVNGQQINVLQGGLTNPANILWFAQNSYKFSYISSIGAYRKVYAPPGGTGIGQSGPAGPTILPFLIGPTWDPNSRTDNIAMPPLDYLEAKRSPKWGDFAEHGAVDRIATIRIIDSDGTCWYATSNYIITGVQKREQTRFIKTQTSEGDYILMAGSTPKMFRFTGELLSMNEYEYAKDWQWNWDRYLKGTVTSENNARFYLLYGGWVVEGHLTNYQMIENAQSPFKHQLLFDVYVTAYIPLPKMSVPIDPQVTIETERYESKESAIPQLRSDGTYYRYDGLSLAESIQKEANEETV